MRVVDTVPPGILILILVVREFSEENAKVAGS